MSPPISFDANNVSNITIDGSSVQEVTMDGDVVWSAGGPIPNSVVTRYKFEDDADTSTALDSVGNNDGSINGASYTSSPYQGDHALQFDGSDDLVDCNTKFANRLGDSDATVSAVFRNDNSSPTNNYIWSEPTGNDNWFRIRADGNSDLEVKVAGTKVSFSTTVDWDSGNHVVCSYDSSQTETTVYLNDSNIGTINASLPSSGGDNALIGHGNKQFSSGHWDGLIDDVMIANDNWSSSEVSDVFSNYGI